MSQVTQDNNIPGITSGLLRDIPGFFEFTNKLTSYLKSTGQVLNARYGLLEIIYGLTKMQQKDQQYDSLNVGIIPENANPTQRAKAKIWNFATIAVTAAFHMACLPGQQLDKFARGAVHQGVSWGSQMKPPRRAPPPNFFSSSTSYRYTPDTGSKLRSMNIL